MKYTKDIEEAQKFERGIPVLNETNIKLVS